MSEPLNIGVIGTTGYPAALMSCLDRFISPDVARIAAVDDSLSQPVPHTASILERHGARRVQGVEALLDVDGLDAVIVATSIDSHLPYTRAALERGLAVHCEKPVAATVDDALAMIAARDHAGLPVQIGFQDTYSPSVQWGKRQILDGVIGEVRRVRVRALWPRPSSYYARNDWAGALKRDGRWVLDSPAHNALAHQINLALYMSGDDAETSNTATHVEAELYRARDITNYDTCAFRCRTAAGCDVLILFSHACATLAHPVIEFIGTRGVLRRIHPDHCELEIDGEPSGSCHDGPRGAHGPMFDNLVERLTGRAARSRCEIENALEVTRVVNGASQCATVHRVDERHVKRVAPGEDANDEVRAIDGVEAVFAECVERFALPSELGDLAWAGRPGRLDLVGYDHFAGVPG